MKKQRRRTGGVSDYKELIAQEHIEYFAEEHEFPDPAELKKRLDLAFTASEIFRKTPAYPVNDATNHLAKLSKNLSKLTEHLEAEPFFSEIGLQYAHVSREELQSTLFEALRSVAETKKDIHDKKLRLPNANNARGRPPPRDTAFLEELKQIHWELTGEDVWVTIDYTFDASEVERYRGKFFDFAYACFNAARYAIEPGTLADRITTLHKKLQNAKVEKS